MSPGNVGEKIEINTNVYISWSHMGQKVIDLSTNKIYDSIGVACVEFKIKRCTLARYLSGISPNKTTLQYYGGRYLDLSGKKFGRWTVIELDKLNDKKQFKWICKCECGNITSVFGSSLTTGFSSGCRKCKITKKDITGKKFGKLTVIEESGTKQGNYFCWTCKCECGNIKIINGAKLRSGTTKSCGCLKGGPPRKENRELITYERLYRDLKYRNREYNSSIISFQEFMEFSKLNCHYCNSLPSNIATDATTKASFNYTGLDQILPGKGYTKNNVVPCCKFCNVVKNDMLQDEFKNHVIKIYNFSNKKIISNKFKNKIPHIEQKELDFAVYKKFWRVPDREFAILNRAYTRMRQRASCLKTRKDQNSFITFEYFKHLSYGNCFYCGGAPSKMLKDRIPNSNEIIYVNGIDRIDSNKDYMNGNVRSCCKRCNQGKMQLSDNEFTQVINNIYDYWACKNNI